MIKNRFKIFDAFGIPVYLDLSFGIILLFLALQVRSLELGFGMAMMLAFSILFHELAHSLTARLFGYRTADITLSLLGGCASLCALPRRPYQELLVAIAGPISSFVLSFIAYLTLIFLPLSAIDSYGGTLLYYALVMNIVLGSFNLLPALPMDGGRVFRSLLALYLSRVDSTRIAMYVGRVMAVLLVVLPMFGVERLWIIPIGGSIFFRFLIAYMIWQEGYREYLIAKIENPFRRWSQDDFRARVSPPPYDED